MAQTTVNKDERSLGELFSELAGETGTLVRQEVALAQTELTQKAVKVGKNVGFLVAGGAVGYAGFLAIIAGIILVLARFVAPWLAAIIVGAVIAVIAFFLISKALTALKNMDLTPKQTVESLKEDAQWLKNQAS